MPSEDAEPHAQRAWRAEAGTWSVLRQAARDNRAKPTVAEAMLWARLRHRGLEGSRFRRQHAIGRFIVDFYCSEANLVVEVDGPIHRYQEAEDTEREAELEGRGLRVIRFSNDEVMTDMAAVLRRIAAHLTPNPSPTSERGTQRL
ncbi:MAG TPA: endonuclease domain-containing protein [Dehalococcoidia bacterium]|nr:endonuclease domain-containing protein [Dehalococcoidia bacterium]